MFATKVYKDYPAMRDIIEECDERFIIGLDLKVLSDSKMIFFKIQKAFWYYKDKFEKLIKERRIPSMPLDMFGQLLIEESQVLSRIYPHGQREAKYREWQDYLRRVPRMGAICINPSLDKVLMIQPFGRNRKCLQFPRGKLHAGEDHAKAAAREVWEECGIRIENIMNHEDYFEATIDSTLHKLYMVFPVMEELVPTIQCNKEIEQILWFPIDQLPGWSSRVSYDDRGFFGVAPFVSMLKGFVKQRRKTAVPALLPKDRMAALVGSVQILKRPPKLVAQHDDTYEENKEDPEADRFNRETFADTVDKGWSFEDMLNANQKLGFKTTYTDESDFDKIYSVSAVQPAPKRTELAQRLIDAFMSGWNSCS